MRKFNESVDYEVWHKLRSDVLEVLNDLAYYRAFISLGKGKQKQREKKRKLYAVLTTLLDIVGTCMTVETGKDYSLNDSAKYKWLQIDFDKAYVATYRTYKMLIK